MQYQRVELKKVLKRGPQADQFLFTCRPNMTELINSIDKNGLLEPPFLRRLETGNYQIICGFRRLRALHHLAWQQAEAFIVSEREWTDTDCLKKNILENYWHRGFNEVEKALLFTSLADRFFHLLPQLAHLLEGDIKMPQDSKALGRYRFILSLPEPVRDGLAQSEISLGQGLLLRSFPEDARILFFNIMKNCGLTLQESRRAAEWITEIGQRDETGPKALMEEDAVSRLFEETPANRQRAQQLLSQLRKKRFPLMESWKTRFTSAQAQTGIQGKGIQISHDPTFESTQLKIQLTGRSEAEMINRIETIARAAREGRMERLFHALQV